jgi:hypothetical protein
MTLGVWTNLTVLLDGKVTANALMLKVLDQVYLTSPLPTSPAPLGENIWQRTQFFPSKQ